MEALKISNMSQITQEQLDNRAAEIRRHGNYPLYIAELQLKVEALEKETGESDEDECLKWWINYAIPEHYTLNDIAKSAWLASRKSKA